MKALNIVVKRFDDIVLEECGAISSNSYEIVSAQDYFPFGNQNQN